MPSTSNLPYSGGTPKLALQQARQLLREGAPVPPDLLPHSLAVSWERSGRAGLRPGDRALFHHSVSSAEQRRVALAHIDLVDVAQQDLEQLRHRLPSPRWVVLLTNSEGTIVHAQGLHDHAPRELRMPLHSGRKLLEAELGTNAPGVVLHDGEAALVRRGEHFLEELQRFSCAAAPVHHPDGRLAGVIDATGFDVDVDEQIAERVYRTAGSVEHRLFERAARAPGLRLLQLEEDARFLGTPLAGLLLAREDGRVVSMNRQACRLLGLDRIPRDDAEHLAFEQLFGDRTWQLLLNHRPSGAPLSARLQDGPLLHLRFQSAPKEDRSSVRVSPPPESALTVDARAEPSPAPPSDARWQAALSRADRVFPLGVPVLVLGETGTGKEWFARQLHQRHRPGSPFVAVDCSSLTESLAEAELFGHVEGAYTGSRKGGAPGRLERAQGGTLLLDEIGDMPMSLQTRLLRVLQERRFSRLGSQHEIKLDVLVVAATHRNLREMVQSGRFREDLYFRLNGLHLELPPLRERTDLHALLDDCLNEFACDGLCAHVTAPARERLLAYAWPGNVRQFRHTMQVACALAGASGEIDLGLLPDELTHGPPAALPGGELQAVQREHIARVLAKHRGNVSAAARQLGISRTTLYARLRH